MWHFIVCKQYNLHGKGTIKPPNVVLNLWLVLKQSPKRVPEVRGMTCGVFFVFCFFGGINLVFVFIIYAVNPNLHRYSQAVSSAG